jgi:multidrug efflux pump subunit AcrB
MVEAEKLEGFRPPTGLRASLGGQTGQRAAAEFSPSVYADIDREKAEKVGLTPTDVFNTLQVYLGSQYVNDFNYLGRTYR